MSATDVNDCVSPVGHSLRGTGRKAYNFRLLQAYDCLVRDVVVID